MTRYLPYPCTIPSISVAIRGLAALLLLSGVCATQAEITPATPRYAYPGGYGDGANESSSETACADDGRCIGVSMAGPPSMFGGPTGIFVSRSLDYGMNWDAPTYVSVPGTTRNLVPKLTWAGGTSWVVIWHKLEGGGSFGGNPEVYTARSNDNGVTWSTPRYLNNNGSSLDDWVESSGSVASDHAGKVVAVWGANGDEQDFIRRAVSLNGGATWSNPVNVPSMPLEGGDSERSPSIHTDGNGNWLLVWAARRPQAPYSSVYNNVFSRSTDNAVTWSAPQYLVPQSSYYGDSPNTPPAIASDGAGGWAVAWSGNPIEADGTDSEVLVSRSVDNGITWTAPVIVNHLANSDGAEYNGGTDRNASIAYDGAGRLVVAWSSDVDIAPEYGTDSEVLVSLSEDGGATWTDAVPLNATATEDGTSADSGVSLTRVANETFLATWSTTYDFEAATDSESAIVYGRLLTGDVPDGVYDFSVEPVLAQPGDTVRIAFKIGQPLLAHPQVTVNGEPAQRVAGAKSVDYRYEYEVPEWTALGNALVQVTATSATGDPVTYTNNALHIVASLDAVSTPMMLALALFLAVLTVLLFEHGARAKTKRTH